MSWTGVHDDWFSLIEISGPFLAVPVLKEAFPQGLDELDGLKRKRLRQAYEEWREALDSDDRQFTELHQAWIGEVLCRGLEFDENGRGDVLKKGDQIPESLRVTLPEHGVTLAPDFVVVNASQDNRPLLLIQTYAVDADLDAAITQQGWVASPAERMVQLCRMTGCRIGLVTNGERWMLVDAPVGAVTTFASWYARIWSQEPITLQAFLHLLGIRRFFYDQSEQLPALFDLSLQYQDEVTDALGLQVRRAVEVLIQALDKADLDRNRELLHDIAPAILYEAGLTVMMRLVFLLAAEERGLLLLGDERYEANYAISTLRLQLRTVSEEILERRWDAWSRLLAIFRAVFGGIEHEKLRLPALGGSLFDPDRFPFLEGRATGTNWRNDIAKPLPIDNRTVLLLLEAIQQFQGRTLSYRALDVEQIGYVYEGLLERTVKRTDEVTLELDATKSAKTPWVKLGELESAKLDGDQRLAELLKERMGSSASRVRNDLAKPVDDILADKLLTACQGDTNLRNRIKIYAHLLRTDPWGYPLVYPKGAFIVTTGSDRRETGAHYTPKSLTEAIVLETLTPVVYIGPAEGKPKVDWILKSPAELLELKICDPAMGSGAFLVQVCRWLAERLVEAWFQAELSGQYVTVDGEVCDMAAGEEPLPRDAEERTIIARRLIAERCLYGVDLNPLAVELAKLSIWLVTLAKGRPFGFLDHNLRCGDSLLGIYRLDQLTELSMTPGQKNVQMRLFGKNIEQAVAEAIELRKRLRQMPIRDIHDVETMAKLDADAKTKLEAPERIADAFISEVFRSRGNGSSMDAALTTLSIEMQQYLQGDTDSGRHILQRANQGFSIDLPEGKGPRQAFHWPLEFPEVISSQNSGFDAIVGNPPFLGGKRITGVMGTAFRDWLVFNISEGRRGSADLVAYFFLRAFSLLRDGGEFGLLAVNTIAEGDTRQVGLEAMISANAVINAAYPNEPWPGKAAVVTSRVHIYKGKWLGHRSLLGKAVSFISPFLSDREEWSPKRLKANEGISFQGSIVLGMGFILTNVEAERMIDSDSRNAEVIFPYLNGDDLNSNPEQKSSRWVISFWDWSEERAQTYSLPYEWILSRVKPERQRRKENGEYALRNPLPERWWQYADKRPTLYHAIGRGHQFEQHPKGWNKNLGPISSVLVAAQTTKYLSISFQPNDEIFSHMTIVFALDDPAVFATLNSTFHAEWVRKYSSSLETRMRYIPTDCFETYPLPYEFIDSLKPLGLKLKTLRNSVMTELGLGLTKLYNRFHDPSYHDSQINELRKLHCDIDLFVAHAYGWDDLELKHGFHKVTYLPENDCVRYTISEPVRIDVLRRLSELNHRRYEEEVADGLHGKSTNKKKPARSTKGKASTSQNSLQTNLFDLQDQTTEPSKVLPIIKNGNAWGSNATDQILSWLEAQKGWFPKSAILNGCGANPDTCDSAINELIKDDFIESRRDGNETRYRAKE
jgi:hypothetical protein